MENNAIIVGPTDLPFTPVHQIPNEYQIYLNHNAGAYYFEYEQLTVLTQLMRVREFSIFFHLLNARRKAIVYPYSSRQAYALYYQDMVDVPGNLQTAGNVLLQAKKCILLNLAPGYQQAEIEPGITICTNVNIEPYLVPGLCRSFPAFRYLKDLKDPGAIVGLTPFELNAVCCEILRRIEECGFTGEIADYYLHRNCGNYYQNFIRQLIHSHTRSQPAEEEIAILHRVPPYITNHLSERLTIKMLSEKFKLPEENLKRGFDQVFCISIPAYINQERMDKAFQLLITTTKPIGAIAAQLGYKSQEALFQAFIAHYGCHPMLLRNVQ